MDRRLLAVLAIVVAVIAVMAAGAHADRQHPPTGPPPGGHWGIWAFRFGR